MTATWWWQLATMPSTPAAAQQLLFTMSNELAQEGWTLRAFDNHGSTVYLGATCGGE